MISIAGIISKNLHNKAALTLYENLLTNKVIKYHKINDGSFMAYLGCQNNENKILSTTQSEKSLIYDGYLFKQNNETKAIEDWIDKFSSMKSFPLHELEGMYSLVVWDSIKEILTLNRDVFGSRPLYYYFNEKMDYVIFASTIDIIIQSIPSLKWSMNKQYCKSYFMNHATADFHLSPITNIQKVLPGEIIQFGVNSKYEFEIINKEKVNYYTAVEEYSDFTNHIGDICENILTHFDNINNTKTNVLLSGGVDSSFISILALLQKKNISKFIYLDMGDTQARENVYSLCKNLKRSLEILTLNRMDRDFLNKSILSMIEPTPSTDYPFFYYYASKNENTNNTIISGHSLDEILFLYPWLWNNQEKKWPYLMDEEQWLNNFTSQSMENTDKSINSEIDNSFKLCINLLNDPILRMNSAFSSNELNIGMPFLSKLLINKSFFQKNGMSGDDYSTNIKSQLIQYLRQILSAKKYNNCSIEKYLNSICLKKQDAEKGKFNDIITDSYDLIVEDIDEMKYFISKILSDKGMILFENFYPKKRSAFCFWKYYVFFRWYYLRNINIQ